MHERAEPATRAWRVWGSVAGGLSGIRRVRAAVKLGDERVRPGGRKRHAGRPVAHVERVRRRGEDGRRDVDAARRERLDAGRPRRGRPRRHAGAEFGRLDPRGHARRAACGPRERGHLAGGRHEHGAVGRGRGTREVLVRRARDEGRFRQLERELVPHVRAAGEGREFEHRHELPRAGAGRDRLGHASDDVLPRRELGFVDGVSERRRHGDATRQDTPRVRGDQHRRVIRFRPGRAGRICSFSPSAAS